MSQRLVLRCKPSQEGDKDWLAEWESQRSKDGMQQSFCFKDNTAHEEFFREAVSDWVADTLDGHNLIILLYGLPSSGKSYTAFGSPGESRSNSAARGIIVRCMDEFIKSASFKNKIAEIKGSFYHITSKGQVSDLLNPIKRNLQAKRINDSSFIFPGVTQQPLTRTQDVVDLLEKALLMRNATGIIRSNAIPKSGNPLRVYKPHSTHAVFQYTVESCSDIEAFASQLIVIDLAGSQIENFYKEESECEDIGLSALHDTLTSLSDGNRVAAESCSSTPLTQVIHPGLFGNSRFVFINTILMIDSEELVTRKILNFCKSLYNCKAVSTPVCHLLSQTNLGSKMIRIDDLKRVILQELNLSNEHSAKLEIISQTAVNINGMVIEQLSAKCLEAIAGIRDLERERLSKQVSSQVSTRKDLLPPLKIGYQKGKPLPSVFLTQKYLPPSPQKATLAPLNLIKDPRKKALPEESSSTSDSGEDENAPQNLARCPPPLKDIPHVLPVLPVKQSQTSQRVPAGISLKAKKPIKSGLRPPNPISTGTRCEDSLSSSSSSSIAKDQPKKRNKKRKTKAKPGLAKQMTTSSSGDDTDDAKCEEDTFDPGFKPGKLSFHPQPMRQEYIPRETMQPITQIKPSFPSVEVTGTMLPSYEESSRNEAEVPVSSELISQHELHQSALFGAKISHLKKLVMKYGVDYSDEGGHTALMYSVLGKQTKICESLISMGADVNATDSSNLTALFWAVYHARPEIMKVLLRNGADVHITDPHGRSVFHWVMKTPNILCLKALCKYASGNIENQTDLEGLTPLHWAVMCEQHQHIGTLLSSVPATNVNARDPKGRTALNYAVLLFSPICIKAILECSPAAVTFRDFKGRTALHYACAEGSADCIRALLACKSCDLHSRDDSGTTPLHWAAAANQPGIVQLLLRRGADRGQKDNSDYTPLDHANQRNYTECVKILETYGLLRQSSSWSIASQFSIHPPTPPELDEHGHVPMKRLSSFAQSPQDDDSETDTDQCRLPDNGPRLPADGHSSTDAMLPTEEAQHPINGENVDETELMLGNRATITSPNLRNANRQTWKHRLKQLFCIFSSQNSRVAPA